MNFFRKNPVSKSKKKIWRGRVGFVGVCVGGGRGLE